MNLRWRSDLAFWTAVVAGTLCVAAGSVSAVLSRNIFDAEVFGERAEESLSDPGVAAYAADWLSDAAIKSSPDLVAFRPLIVASAGSIVSARPFRALVGTAAREAHYAAFSAGGRNLVLSLPDAEVLLRSALQQAGPQLAEKLPSKIDKVTAFLGNSQKADVIVRLWRLGRQLRWLTAVLLFAGPVLLVVAVFLAPNRRRAVVRAGIALVIASLGLAVIVPGGRLAAAVIIHEPLERGLAQGLWRTYLGELESWALFLAGFGLLAAAGATSLLESVDPLKNLRVAGMLLVAPPPMRAARTVWAIVLLGLGLTAIRFPREVMAAVSIVAGVCAAFVGLRELFRLLLETVGTTPETAAETGDRRWLAGAAVVCVVAILLGTVWLFWRRPAVEPVAHKALACNGAPELCGRRVDQVVFPAAHNAMSNREIADWMFPHQERTIPHQLQDGVRALLIDVHYGFPGGARIKTDMNAEPMAGKVEEAVGKEGYQAALRIRNRLVGVDEKRRRPYLCHAVCELGAYEFEPTMREVRDFMVEHPDEVLLIVLEDYVTPQDIASAIESGGLARLVYRGPVTAPWPTLGELIESGQRVLVFLESGRAGVPWLRPAFESIQETPYSFHKTEEFSCRPNRGGTSGSLFQINHWIETTPTPKPSNAAIVNAYEFLLHRAEQCENERQHLPNIIAVDFYHTGDLLKVARKLNGLQP